VVSRPAPRQCEHDSPVWRNDRTRHWRATNDSEGDGQLRRDTDEHVSPLFSECCLVRYSSPPRGEKTLARLGLQRRDLLLQVAIAILVSGQASALPRLREKTTFGIAFIGFADGWYDEGQKPAIASQDLLQLPAQSWLAWGGPDGVRLSGRLLEVVGLNAPAMHPEQALVITVTADSDLLTVDPEG
jgi:hypothetical protein